MTAHLRDRAQRTTLGNHGPILIEKGMRVSVIAEQRGVATHSGPEVDTRTAIMAMTLAPCSCPSSHLAWRWMRDDRCAWSAAIEEI